MIFDKTMQPAYNRPGSRQIDPRLTGLLMLQTPGNTVEPALFEQRRPRLTERKGDPRRPALLPERQDPIEIANPGIRSRFAPSDHLFRPIRRQPPGQIDRSQQRFADNNWHLYTSLH